jgi:hypothetical protein
MAKKSCFTCGHPQDPRAAWRQQAARPPAHDKARLRAPVANLAMCSMWLADDVDEWIRTHRNAPDQAE